MPYASFGTNCSLHISIYYDSWNLCWAAFPVMMKVLHRSCHQVARANVSEVGSLKKGNGNSHRTPTQDPAFIHTNF